MTVTKQRTYTLVFAGRPWLTNEAMRLHHLALAARTKQLRQDAFLAAMAPKVPPMDRIIVTVEPWISKGRRWDAGAVSLWAKAVIDGLADAGVIPHDGPVHVIEERYRAPVSGAERDEVLVTIEEA